MRMAALILIAAAAGCADPPERLSKPQAVVDVRGEVQQGAFSADGKAFIGWVTPVGKDPAVEQSKPKTWLLWSIADGKEAARWTGDPTNGFANPGLSDGTNWPVYLSGPPKYGVRCRLLDLTTGTASDVPGLSGPTDSCTAPSFSANRKRLAYAVDALDPASRTVRVYEKTAAGWTRIAEAPGENAKLSPDGTLVATVGEKRDDRWKLAVRVFGVADKKERWSAPVDSYALRGFTPDGRYLIQADNAGHRLFDVATGRQQVLVANGPRGDSQGPSEVAYWAGWVAAIIRFEKKVELVRWDVALGKEVSRTAIDCPYGRNRTPPFGSSRLAAPHPVQNHPVPGRKGAFRTTTTVDVYDPAAAEPVAQFTLGEGASIITSPDGGALAAVGRSSLRFYPLPDVK